MYVDETLFGWSVFFIILFSIYYALVFLQIIILFARMKKDKASLNMISITDMSSEHIMPISVIIPLSEKADESIAHIKECMQLEYPNIEFIAISDGINKDYDDQIIKAFQLGEIECSVKTSIPTAKIHSIYFNPSYQNFVYIVKRKAGITDSLNCGINVSKFPLITILPVGCIVEKDALLKLAGVFLKDSVTVMSSGLVRLSCNTKRKDISYFYESLERIKGSFFDLFNRFSYNTIFTENPEFALFNKQMVIDCGGYTLSAIDPYRGLILKINKLAATNKRKIAMHKFNDVICKTQPKKDFLSILSSHKRWQSWMRNSLVLNFISTFIKAPSFYRIVSYLYSFIFDFVIVICTVAAFVTIPGAVLFGMIEPVNFLLLCFCFIILEVAISLFALILNQYSNDQSLEIKKRIVFVAVIKNFGMAQLVSLVRFIGIFSITKKPHTSKTTTKNK